jgi:multidrug efflux pump subunit AcrA (membrane-fusion protein)
MKWLGLVVLGFSITAAVGWLVLVAPMLEARIAAPRLEQSVRSLEFAPAPSPAKAAEAPDEGMLGVVVPGREVYLGAATMARIASIDVGPGDRVEAGAPLVELDARADERALAGARAAARAARAETARLDIEARRSGEALERAEQVQGYLPEQEVSDLRYARGSAAAGRRRAGASAQEQWAQVEQISQRIEDSVIRSPFAGIVVQRFAEPGAVLSPGEPLVHLISDALLVRFAAGEDEGAALYVGTPITVTFEDLGIQVHATVSAVVPEIDSAARIIIGEAALSLEPGMEDVIKTGAMVRVFFGHDAALPLE